MPPTIAVLAPGAMGSAVARRLSEHGARVLTSLKGRSPATQKRAADAGMIDADDAAISFSRSFRQVRRWRWPNDCRRC